MQVSKIKNLIEQNRSGAGKLVVVEGLHAIKHALRFGAKVEYLITRDKSEVVALSQKLCADISDHLEKEAVELGDNFNRLSSSIIRTGVIGIFHKPKELEVRKGSYVLLDDPRDLDNIGAVIRVCAAANINKLIVTGKLNPWNSRSIRAAAGLQFALTIKRLSVEEVLSLNIPIISFDERGEVLNADLKAKLNLQNPEQTIYVFGSERDGISNELKDASTKIIRLPMQEKVSSLNLATSVAAALYSIK